MRIRKRFLKKQLCRSGILGYRLIERNKTRNARAVTSVDYGKFADVDHVTAEADAVSL
jgi:hypothetical protein